MNFIFNITIFNPLEALLLILFVAYIGNFQVKINSKTVMYCYLLGTANLFVQSLPYLSGNYIIMIILNFTSLFLMAVFLWMMYNFEYNKCNFNYCICAVIFIFISTVSIIFLLDKFLFVGAYVGLYIDTLPHFVSNTIIKIVQFIILFLIRRICKWEIS